MEIRMSPQEKALFMAFVSKASSYFEFGMGGSTKAAAEVVEGPIVAVESDKAWIDMVAGDLPNSQHKREFVFVDVGPTKKFGYPASKTKEQRKLFPAYSGAIVPFKELDFDLCLVDGRFRVACFLEALKCLNPYAVIAMHDYRSRRGYHVVEEFARPIAEARDLAFFVRRPDLDSGKLDAALTKHRYVAH